MNDTIRRKGVVGTIGDALTWLQRNPVLIVIFFLYGLLSVFGELLGTAGILLGLLGYLVGLYVNGLVHMIGAYEATNARGDLGRASAAVLGQFVSLIGVGIAYALAVTVGFVFLILPGIYLAVRLSLALPACVIDEQDAVDSLRTSWTVAKGNLRKLFGISVVSFLVVGGVGAATVPLVGTGAQFDLALLAVTAILTAVVTPIVQFAYARVYLENRPDSEPEPSDGSSGDDSWDDGTNTDSAQW